MRAKSSGIAGRRRFLQAGGAAIAGAALGPLLHTERAIAQAGTVYVNTWGGSWTAAEDAAFFKPFTQATGIQVRTVAPVSYAKLKAQVASGSYEWDVGEINQSDWVRAEREGLVERRRLGKPVLTPKSSRTRASAAFIVPDRFMRSASAPAGL